MPPFTEPSTLAYAGHAAIAWKPIGRALLIGRIEAWSLVILGGLSMICGISSATGLVVGGALLILGVKEMKLLGRVRRLDASALPTLVGLECILIAVLWIYFGYQCYANWTGQGIASGDSADLQQIRDFLGDQLIQQMNEIAALIYVVLILVVGISQGLMARMYHRRKAMLRSYLARTPQWILALQQHGMQP